MRTAAWLAAVSLNLSRINNIAIGTGIGVGVGVQSFPIIIRGAFWHGYCDQLQYQKL
jgi:hypothetical protein